MKPLRTAHAAWEREYIARALRAHEGNVSETAEALEISRRALTVKMAEHELGDLAAGLRTKAGIKGPRRGP